uniref:MAPK activated protein kinase 5 n=1 Tax=Oncorhynchus kisutch TaxID=8019 RepID=A0A8C7JIM1_ONCKI
PPTDLQRRKDAPVKLCDFGFAKIDQGDLMTPQFTPYYVAPQVLEAQRRHQKEKSGIIPTSPTPYTYNKVSNYPTSATTNHYPTNGSICFFFKGFTKISRKHLRMLQHISTI